MENFLVNYGVGLRLFIFIAILFGMSAWELRLPKRNLTVLKSRRWVANLGIMSIGSILVVIVIPISGYVFAEFLADRGIGLFNMSKFNPIFAFVVSFLVLDFVVYLQHRAFHKYFILWKLHQVHHTDMDFDTTTGIRFHPVEIFLSMLIKFSVIAILGVPALAFFVFEVFLNGTSLFNHGNVRMPKRVDRLLRKFVVTPDMHRVHHSVIREELNSNFGFNLPWWDYMWKTYVVQPEMGHDGMTIGLAGYRDEKELGLVKLLAMPFVKRRKD
jgi:sterol desaturase/sphingolipid hydroxylase (fatty acid hydroxylase superfamily)